MYYAISHLTLYKYSEPISDSVMELRMQPRSDGNQHGIRFNLHISPDTRYSTFKDYLGNTVHNFNIPALHESLAIKAESIVEIQEMPELPEALSEDAWSAIDAQATQDRDFYDMLLPGKYTRPTELLSQFESEINWQRRDDPLSLAKELNSAIYHAFEYNQHVTRVDSPIDVALRSRHGVCQDFTHIMLTMLRKLGIPARYVSGYLFHRQDYDRSDVDASHAWAEVWLPQLGWIGFDPTNNLIVNDRHIRVNVSNDYANASPSRGVFKGNAETELEVRVQVSQLQALPYEYVELAPEMAMPKYKYYQPPQEQQQQQQQQ